MKTDEKYLSDEEISQLKGGAEFKNINKAAYCLCDNKPDWTVTVNKNTQEGCRCYCSYSIPPGTVVNPMVNYGLACRL